MTDVDVLLVNYLTADLAIDALDAVSGPDVSLHVWDNSGELLARSPAGLEVLGGDRNILYAPASNELYRRGDAPWVLLLNPDVLLSREGLEKLVAALEGDPAAWGVAPALVNVDGTPQNYRRRLPTLTALLADRCPPLRPLLRRAYRRYRCTDDPVNVAGLLEQPAAACLVLRRAAVGPVLFDESYPLFFNDTDLARRLNLSGHCRYVPSVVATHVGGASISRVRTAHAGWIRREYDRSLLRYARRNLPGWWLLTPILGLRRLLMPDVAPPADVRPMRP